MTTPTNDRITAAEIRELFAGMTAQIESLQRETGGLRTNIEDLQTELHAIRNGLQTAATPPASDYKTILATRIERETKKGKSYYRIFSPEYPKHGVRVWDEVMIEIGLDPAALEWDETDTYKIDPPLSLRVMLGETTNQETGKTGIGPRKVTGKA